MAPTDTDIDTDAPASPPGAPHDGEPAEEATAEGPSRWGRAWHVAKWPVIVGGGFVLLGVIVLAVIYFSVDLPKDPPALSSSAVFDAKGREIAAFEKDGLRIQVRLDQVAPVVTKALIASEDRHFYSHRGVDPIGITRAFVHDLRGGPVQGGSTITQQLVKNSYLNSNRSLTRKVKEAVLAVKLERREDKDKILERYLNTVYFGRGTYGIEAAARNYFGVSAKDLQLQQAALLIGLLRAPESAEPTTHPDVATERRNSVLDDMVETKAITAAQAAAAKKAPLGAIDRQALVALKAGVAPHFVELVRQQVIARYGEATVYGGGLKIHTTLDIDDQQAAEASIAKVLDQPNDPQAALVALDQTGAVKAYVGGRDFKTLQVDLARGKAGGGTGRQPGSTFKPFVLADALEQGATLGETFAGPPQITLNTDAGPWTVDNYGGESFGSLSLLDATAHSVNTVYAQLMLGVGPPTVPPLAARMGITSPLKPDPSLVLGTGEVSPLELADSYLTFARDGSHVAPHVIAEIDNAAGKVLFKAQDDKGEQAMKPETARGVTYALRQVIAKGTGTAAKLDRPVAGKTGTTTDFGDAWFAGYTPNYAAVVWMGYPEGPTHQMTDVHGRSVTGGSFPAQIWQSFMKAALADVPVADFPPPPPDMLKPAPPAQLAVNPSSGDPGVQLTVQGSGFRACFAGWYVSFEPQTVQLAPGSSPPAPVKTTPQTSSNEDQRTVQFPVPSGSPPGQYLVRAWCDAGSGPQPMGEVQFTVTGAAPTTLPPPPTVPPTTRPGRTTTTTAPTTTTPTTAKH